ncbi:hypothetical protein PYW07_011770 [Mythimna separata]|uniref:Uncharacterized protein n=1 Tax=Mythimna separata TaxID=271217 RepID=A0AAD7Y6Q3_MYTSE|nr:hypothetical protein PYW07_011770 [Mythimna separata]
MEKEPVEEGLSFKHDTDGALFGSQEHFKKEMSRLCYGDLYVIGRLWIQGLRKVLVGANFSLIPVVHAAKPLEMFFAPKKPPKMKYKDLPLYESPHYEYKDYMEDKKKCPKANVKILHTYLFPKVQSYRKSWSDSIRGFNKEAKELKDDGSPTRRFLPESKIKEAYDKKAGESDFTKCILPESKIKDAYNKGKK